MYKYSIYLYTIDMKRSVSYPDWAEKYRGKGRTIRKVRDGYGLYECTSVYVPGLKYPKSVQKYLGMITEKDGFIPKKNTVSLSASSVSLEYGLSHFIISNFKRDLTRAVYRPTDELILFGIICYIFGDFDPVLIRYTWLSHGRESELEDRAAKGVNTRRLKIISSKIDSFIAARVPDQKDRNLLERLLFLTTINPVIGPDSVVYPSAVLDIMERNGLKQ